MMIFRTLGCFQLVAIDWAAQIARQCRALHLPAPVAADGSDGVIPISYRSRVLEKS